jgi:2-amino-4-hydroxy-6-hydroxymethyldihydropteridine diphosphokinase
MKLAYLGLGTNLGNREANLEKARAMLESDRLRVLRASSIWETAPRDVIEQPFFLNQVIEVETDWFPLQLLNCVKEVERRMGRVKTQPKGPRLIDIDILLYANSTVNTADLKIPHPALGERRFVLEPLAELTPDLRHPLSKQTVREMLKSLLDQAVRRI